MPLSTQEKIQAFLRHGPFAVVGASTDRSKYGNKVLRCYMQQGMQVYPVNPGANEVEGLRAFPDLASLPCPVPCISVITPPRVTEKLVEEAAVLGVKRIWMQPGAESPVAIERAESLGMEVIAGGPCLLVVLGYHEC